MVDYNGNSLQLDLNVNDVKIVLAKMIGALLDPSKLNQEGENTFSTPIVHAGCYAWVKYQFSSEFSVESGCCSDAKKCDFIVVIKYFYFPSKVALRSALQEIESTIS